MSSSGEDPRTARTRRAIEEAARELLSVEGWEGR